MSAESFYLTPADAAKELLRRRKLPQLSQRVNEYLKGDVPELFTDSGAPTACLYRNIITPDYDLEIFMKQAESIGARPVLAEYTQDRFVTKNEDKYALGRLFFYLNTDSHGQVNTRGFKIIDFNSAQGLPLCDINTVWGESLVRFHHRILNKWHSECSSNIVDLSEWSHRNGGRAKEYYNSIFALFICHAILFENYRDSGPEGEFFRNIFLPSFQRVTNYFEMQPLICPNQAPEDENNPKWWSYPLERMEYICDAARSYRENATQ